MTSQCSSGVSSRAVCKALGDKRQGKITVLSQTMAMIVAKIMGGAYAVVGKKPPLTEKTGVLYCCLTSYFNIEKAKKRLGYKVKVPMQEAIEKSVQVCSRLVGSLESANVV